MNNKIKNKILALSIGLLIAPLFAFAGNITTGTDLGFAWSENAGYVNFGLSSGDVTVTDTAVTGYAWDSIYGWLNLGPILVGGVDYGVKNDGKGNLSGFAWSAGAGWVPFTGAIIDASGKFTGVTTVAAVYGRTTFDCSYCNVVTSWRPKIEAKVSGGTSGGSSIPVVIQPVTIPAVEPTNVVFPKKRNVDNGIPSKKVGQDAGYEEVRAGREDSLRGENGAFPSGYEGSENPYKLFDIEFTADDNVIDNSSKLVTRVNFVSFGKVKTPVSMAFVIEDKNGNVLYRDIGSIDIETEGVYIKKYKDLRIPNGVYTAKLHTLYDENIEDDFSLKFEVKSKAAAININHIFWPILIVIPLFIMVIFKFVLERRKK